MSVLLSDRYQEIAQAIEALDLVPLVNTGSAGIRPNALYRSAARKLGLLEQAQAIGPNGAAELYGIQQLLTRGAILPREASAYLSQRYPDQVWSGAKWAASPQASAKANAATRMTSEQRFLGSPVDGTTVADRTLSAGAGVGEIGSGAILGTPEDMKLVLGQVPNEYSRQAMQTVLEDLRDQTVGRLQAIAGGKIAFRANSIHGAALAPGSVPFTAFDPIGTSLALRQIPGPDEAIGITIAPSSTLDLWAGGTGPGRIWEVNDITYNRSVRLQPGMTRVRLIDGDQRFGVMSQRLELDFNYASLLVYPNFEVRYGIVIAGIPHTLGRPPQGCILLADGNRPVAFGSTIGNNGSSTFGSGNNLWSQRARAAYQAATFPGLSAVGSSTFLDPTATDLAGMAGFTVGLLVGDTDEKLYQELNTLTTDGRRILGEATSPGASLPPGLGLHPPAPPSIYTWDNNAAPGTYGSIEEETATITSANRVAIGVPFRYQDLPPLIPDATSCAVVLQVAMTHTFKPSIGNSWDHPGLWRNHGCQLLRGTGRDWKLDLVLF